MMYAAAMDIHLGNEVGPLKQVVVHRPGEEVVRMTHAQLADLLFDDILSQTVAAREHGILQEILRAGGASVVEVLDLLELALRRAPPHAIVDLMDRVCDLAGVPEVAPFLSAWEPHRLAAGLVGGVYWEEIGGAPMTLSRIRARAHGSTQMPLPPLPNLMFMRDANFAMFDRLVVGRMARGARAREPLLVHFAMRHSGILGPSPGFLFDKPDWDRHTAFRSIEGGDVLVFSPRFVMVGCSERTTPQTIERLANEALFPNFPRLERVYAVMMPAKRSIMHLDTMLTQIDHDLFLGHSPLVVGTRDHAALPVARLRRGRPPEVVTHASILDVLRDELGPQVKLAPCGGQQPLHQEREQWTDGANAVCVAPGKIILYSRNVHTISSLVEDHGFRQVRLSAVQSPEERRSLLAKGYASRRTVFTFSGSELSRARGGARCLTMPIHREGVED